MLATWLTARSVARVYINFVHGLRRCKIPDLVHVTLP